MFNDRWLGGALEMDPGSGGWRLEDLGLKVWVDKGKDEDVVKVLIFLFKIDLHKGFCPLFFLLYSYSI